VNDTATRRVIPIAAAPASGDGTSLYERQRKIHPRSVDGRFTRWRWAMVWLTQLVFYGLPWLNWGGRQAVLFDLEARRFYLFGLVLYPQDLIYLAALLVISALGLFVFTAVAGRLWCGFACPQTVYTELFVWIERKVEGERSARIRLDASSLSAEKLARKSAKHGLWGALSLWTGLSFVGWFTPMRELVPQFVLLQAGPWTSFWVLFYGFATWGNAGFLREQVCRYMCPYARFQSAMFDRDTLIVSYDAARGEPRDAKARNGACVDCTLCVQVCPAGIDIRQGLQYECIGCGVCIDACDKVMDRIGAPRGLIRFTSGRAAAQAQPTRLLRHLARPRVLVYGTILLGLCVATATSLALRTPLKVDVVRDRATLSRLVAGGKAENVYRLQVMNATEQPQRYRVTAAGLPGLQVAGDDAWEVDGAAERWIVVRLQAPVDAVPPGSHPIRFTIADASGSIRVEEKSVFLAPR